MRLKLASQFCSLVAHLSQRLSGTLAVRRTRAAHSGEGVEIPHLLGDGITAPTRVDRGKRKPRSREGEAFQSVLGLGKLSLHTSSSPSNGESPSRSYMRTFRTLSAEHRNEIKHEESRELLCRLRYERRSEID